CLPARETLAHTVQAALEMHCAPAAAPATWALEQFAVPRIHFDVLWRFRATSVRYHFKLDEQGAVLLSEAVQLPMPLSSMIVARSGEPMPHPLLVVMGRRGARRPYFALWLENTELLVPDGT